MTLRHGWSRPMRSARPIAAWRRRHGPGPAIGRAAAGAARSRRLRAGTRGGGADGRAAHRSTAAGCTNTAGPCRMARILEVRSAPTPDGGFVVTHTDITALAAAEAAARERAGLLQTMQDTMRHGIALFGPDQRLIIANPLAAGLAGLQPEELRPGHDGRRYSPGAAATAGSSARARRPRRRPAGRAGRIAASRARCAAACRTAGWSTASPTRRRMAASSSPGPMSPRMVPPRRRRRSAPRPCRR